MRRRNILIGMLAIVVVVATVGGVAFVLHTRAQADAASYPGLQGPVSVVCPGPTYHISSERGSPVIRPRNNCTPSFTQQDVRDYVAHGVFLGSIGVVGKPTVSRIVFLTIGDFTRAVAPGDRTWEGGYPPDMLICYVGLSGKFSFAGGIDPPESLSSASFVLDAHTGNGLVTIADALLG